MGDMKRFVSLFISLLLITLIFNKFGISYAQEKVIQTDILVGSEMSTASSTNIKPKRVNYELAYPGMLPDNPLYFLKVTRDGIVKMLINDPLKKAKFSLLNADKRIFAGKLLIDKGKDKLAIETIEKSNNYLDDAINAIRILKKQNPKSSDIEPFLQQMKIATQKHNEVLEDMEQQFIDSNFSSRFTVQKERIKNIMKTIESLLSKK